MKMEKTLTRSFPNRSLALTSILALALAGCATMPVDAPGATVAATAPAPAPEASVAALPQSTGTTGWGFPIYDLPADPAVRFFRLDNGLKVAILHNGTPAKTAAVRLGFDVGVIDELPSQAGLAHFLEHMAFNGSTNVPEGEMIKLLEREGLAFGPDTNASTGIAETIYILDLPRSEPKLVDTALMLMRETSSNLTLDPAALDRERGVIQSETRTRNNPQRRAAKSYFDFVAPNTPFSERVFTAGENANIDSFKPDAIRSLYKTWYRPDNAALVVVGDVDPAATEAQIRARFDSWQAPGTPLAKTDHGKIDFARPMAAKNFVDPGMQVLVSINIFSPYQDRPETVAEFRRQLLADVGARILSRRFQKIANQPDAPIIEGSVGTGDFFDIARQGSVDVQGKEDADGWKRAVETGAKEINRIRKYGVTAAELRETLANVATAYRNAADQAATRRNANLANELIATVQEEDVFLTPATRLAQFEAFSASITPQMVSQALSAYLTGAAPLIFVSSKRQVPGGEAAILAAYEAASKAPVEPPKEAAATTFGYGDFGTPGTIAATSTVADLGFEQIRFANNVRLNLKQTDFEQGRIRYLIRVGSGMLAIPKDRVAEALFASVMAGQGGTGKHSFDELQQLLAGRQITYGFAVTDDSLQVRGTTTMADLPTQMQVSAAYISDPGYRPEALAKWQAMVPAITAQLNAQPGGVAQAKVPSIVANGDPRFGVPDAPALLAVTQENLRAELADQLARGPVEISVVGAFDRQQVIDAVAKTFGALPVREPELGAFAEARKVRFAADTTPRVLTHAGAADQALVQVFWPTRDDSNAQEDATLSLLAQVMELELLEEVREKLGATYSPDAGSNTSDTYPGYGTLSASIVVAPKDADTVFAAVQRITASLAAKPVSDDLLARAIRPTLERVALNRRENNWWIGVLSESQLRDERLDRYRTVEARLKAVTPAMIQAAAKQYLATGRDLKVRIVPKPMVMTVPQPKPTAAK